MKFFTTILCLTTIAVAQAGHSNVKFPVSPKTTIAQGQNTCGNDAKLSCCKRATYTHDINTSNTGPLAGVLANALGGGPGGDGLGLFGQCQDLSLSAAGIVDPNLSIDRECKQNIACCQNSPSTSNNNLVGVAVPCVALGSIL
ncbi:conidial hydrophobin Hyp1/RodA [Penicillium lagena]|uniref:conidial hydrophobin Hyp1/RodA n=1 Tax=Penicillium lagena TaxID=94218 RepID=UPI002541EC9D|nr:conidial hydrophobin Hyp1/RodA [Penicillium lagena]KAJ5612935.1 conidial hydrophobin Hyp1/RodA [Penicillium lagena]